MSSFLALEQAFSIFRYWDISLWGLLIEKNFRVREDRLLTILSEQKFSKYQSLSWATRLIAWSNRLISKYLTAIANGA
jgi:hypothetical protein